MTYVTQDSLGSVKSMTHSQEVSLWKKANETITPLPPAVISSINESPLSSSQKKQLKKTPLSFVTVFTEFGRDKVIEFIQRVHKAGRRSSWTYNIGGQKVNVWPRNSDAPPLLTAKMATIAHLLPAKSVLIAGQMTVEMGGAMMNAYAAGAKTTISQAQKAAEQTAKNFGIKLPPPPTIRLPFSGYQPGLGQGWEEALAGVGGTLVTVVPLLVVLAPMIVPPLIELAQGKSPKSPTSEQKSKSSAASSSIGKTQKDSKQTGSQQEGSDQKEESPTGGMIVPIVAVGVIGLVALFLIKKK